MSCDVYEDRRSDPHEILGVPRGADRQQVIRAFYRRARNGGHPDTGGDAETFEQIVCARDMLLSQPRRTAYQSDRRAAPADRAPKTAPPPTPAPQQETNKLAVATAVFALFGPVFWPLAIIIGHLALRQIRRTGQQGGTLVPVVLFFLYLLALPVLLGLGLVLIPSSGG